MHTDVNISEDKVSNMYEFNCIYYIMQYQMQLLHRLIFTRLHFKYNLNNIPAFLKSNIDKITLTNVFNSKEIY